MQLQIPIPEKYSDSVVFKVIQVITETAREKNMPFSIITITEEGQDNFLILMPDGITPDIIAYLGVAIGISLEVHSNKKHLTLTP